MEKVCILGLGCIGLPMASLLAVKGFKVQGVDVNFNIVETINQGYSHINEPELNDLVRSAIKSGNFFASINPSPADIFIIAVPSLITKNHLPDITHVKAATYATAPHLTPGNLVILESTIPVGTTEKIAGWINELRPDLVIPSLVSSVPQIRNKVQIFLAHCPERVLPGRILQELVANDRIIGGIDEPSALKAQEFYEKFVCGGISLTDTRTAELIKLVENSFRDVNIAFANELSLICNKLGINVWEVVELANRHPRVDILQPGPGVGGHCITKDPWYIVDSATDESRLIYTARLINDHMPGYIVNRIQEMAAHLEQPVITCLGLSYKADCVELRESPAIKIVQDLSKSTARQILVVEPHVKALPDELAKYDNIKLVDLTTGMKQADLVVLLVNHHAFTNLDTEMYGKKAVLDTRGIWR
ncbi:MAG: UDP-N-acetyl-D-glucosamine 6-dehydrogenase [Pelotomaculum sp. PtaB.Bin104]|nr:MAG: UDP-N-acetyl-D-glucosamine 6-dehydrogenase [Pelotomaculum sp. PtaB.Bin104]